MILLFEIMSDLYLRLYIYRHTDTPTTRIHINPHIRFPHTNITLIPVYHGLNMFLTTKLLL